MEKISDAGTVNFDLLSHHAKEFAEYIIKDGIIEHSEDVVGNLGVNQGGELGFSHLIESLDGDAAAINFRNVNSLYEQFSKTFL